MTRIRIFSCFLLFCLPFLALPMAAKDVVWWNGTKPIEYHLQSRESEPVEVALGLFEHDMRRVTGHKVKESGTAQIEIYQLDELKDKVFRKLQKRLPAISQVIAADDAFCIAVVKGQILVVGSNARGTAYGILELSRMAGVSPWEWWLGVEPEKKPQLSLPDDYLSVHIPSFQQRGITLRDPLATLSTWSQQVMDKGIDEGEVGHHAYREVAHLMLRLRLNALHFATESEAKAFRSHRRNAHAVDSCGIVHNEIRASRYEVRPSSACLGQIFDAVKTMYSADYRQSLFCETSNPFADVYALSLCADMAWNEPSVVAQSLRGHLLQFLCGLYGEKTGRELLPIVEEQQRLKAIRRPEKMDQNFVLSPSEFGNELERYISQCRKNYEKAQTLRKQVAQKSKNAFFALVEAPAALQYLMAEKQLQVQEARQIGRPQSFHIDEEALEAAARSIVAYRGLLQLSAQLNQQTAHGRWNGLLSWNAQKQPVFGEPSLPDKLSEEEIEQNGGARYEVRGSEVRGCEARKAAEYTKAEGDMEPIDLMGHSGRGIKLMPGSSLTYQVTRSMGGKNMLYVALLPLLTSPTQTAKITIQIDDEKPFTLQQAYDRGSKHYRQVRDRGQVLLRQAVSVAPGSHTITIKATDEPVVLDQWMIDTDLNRHFYLIPTNLK